MDSNLRVALFTGSFDPFTIGHKSIVDRGLEIFDKVIVGVGVNSAKKPRMPLEERIGAIGTLYAGDSRVEVTAFEGLAVAAAQQCGARWLLRGARTAADFDYEHTMADINRTLLPGYPVDTVILPSLPGLDTVSSSLVRELTSLGADCSRFLP